MYIIVEGLSKSIFEDAETRKTFMNELGKKLGYKSMDDWYDINQKSFLMNDGRQLHKYYNNSPTKAVMDVYSQHKWEVFKFKIVPNGYWHNQNNRIHYMDWLGKTLGYKEMDDWYNIEYNSFVLYYGETLLTTYYSGSPKRVVMDVYSHHKWLPWLFRKQHNKYLTSIEYHQWVCEIMEGWASKLSIKQPLQWLYVDLGTIERKMQFGTLLLRNHGLHGLLKLVYPSIEWDDQISKSPRLMRAEENLMRLFSSYFHNKVCV